MLLTAVAAAALLQLVPCGSCCVAAATAAANAAFRLLLLPLAPASAPLPQLLLLCFWLQLVRVLPPLPGATMYSRRFSPGPLLPLLRWVRALHPLPAELPWLSWLSHPASSTSRHGLDCWPLGPGRPGGGSTCPGACWERSAPAASSQPPGSCYGPPRAEGPR